MPRASGGKRTAVPQLQTTIMVDVLFILLVFFMLVSEIRQADVDVDLPTLDGAKKQATAPPSRALRVAVDSTGGLHLDGVAQPDLAALRAALEAARGAGSGSSGQSAIPLTVSLRADQAARSGQTIRVIHLLSELGFERIHFEAREGQ